MAVTSVSVILTVFVLKLHHCGPHQTEVPPWIRRWILTYLARAIKCQCTSTRNKSKVKSKVKVKKPNNDFPHYADQQEYYYAPARPRKSHSKANESTEAGMRLVDDNYYRRESHVAEFCSDDRLLRHSNSGIPPTVNMPSLNQQHVSPSNMNHHHNHRNYTSPVGQNTSLAHGHNTVPPSSISSSNMKPPNDYCSTTYPTIDHNTRRFDDVDLISRPEMYRLGITEEILKVYNFKI